MHSLNAYEMSQVEAAKNITAAQILAARELFEANFNGNPSADTIISLVQAIATNHAAIVANINK